MQFKKWQIEPDMEQQTGSKLGKEYKKAVYCLPVYLTSMQSTGLNFYAFLCRNVGLNESQTRIKIAGRNINKLRYADVPL